MLALLIGATAGWFVGRRRGLPESIEAAAIVAPSVPTVLQATPPPPAATRMTRAMLLANVVGAAERAAGVSG